jgi:hypothetical protein
VSALPDRKYPRFCEETAPAPTGTADYYPTARVSPYLRFGGTPGPAQLVDGDYFEYTAWDGTDVEVGVGRYRTGGGIHIERPITEPTWIDFSTNGGALVSWPPGATINIAGTMGGKRFESLHGDAQAVGMIRRSAEDTYGAITPASTSELIAINAATLGLSDAAYALHRLSGSADAQYLKNVFEWRGSSGAGDVAMKFTRLLAGQYVWQISPPGGGLRRVLSIADIPQMIQVAFNFSDYAGSDKTFLEGQTDITLVTPDTIDAGESYVNVLIGNISARAVADDGSADRFIKAVVQRGDGTSLARFPFYNENANVADVPIAMSAPIVFAEAATPGTSYTYQLSADGLVTGAAELIGDSPDLRFHWLIGACLRRT